MDPIEFGEFDLVISNGNINGGATALQWGPDGLLYVVGRNGFVYAIEVDKQTDGQGDTTGYTGEIKWTHDLSAPNFDDDGNLVSGGNRQALGIVVTQDDVTGETIVYASHSDIKIGAGGGGGSGDVGLDTNSGVVTRIKLSVDGNKDVTENESIDLIRGLPRSEENHATNGLALTTDDAGNPILLIASGGHANAGAPSINFVGLPEYTYSAAVLSADLNQLAAIEAAKKSVDPNIDHVFDLPTLDDPTRPNFTDANGDVKIDANFDGVEDSVAEFVDQNGDGIPDWMVDQDGDGDVDADDVADFVATKIVDTNNDGVRDTILNQDGGSAGDNVTGVRGGNDGLNQAKLLVGNPVQIYSTGYRNTYDVLVTEDGRKYTYDNGANGGWGGVAVTDNGIVTNEPNNANQTQNFDQLHEFDEGTHSGHPNPTVASGSDAGLWTSPTENNNNDPLPISQWRELSDTPLAAIGQEDDGLVLPADWDEVVDQALINPNAGVYNEGGTVADGALDSDKGSWNGLAEYTGTAFGGQLQGAILVTQTGGNVKWIKRDVNGNIDVVAAGNGSLSDPNTIVEAADQGLVGDTNKGNTLGIDAVGDSGVDGLGLFNNTIWVGSLGGGNKITIFEAGGEPAGADLDKDDDGIDHVADYYEFSDTQGVDHVLDDLGTTTTVNAGETRVYNLSAESYSLSAPGGIGQLGYMVNLTDPSAEGGLLSADENIIPGGAGSGLQIKDIRSGTAKGADNDQKDALTFAVTPGADAGRLEISTTMNAILGGFYQDGSEAGLQIGTGDQFSFMSLVLAYSGTGTLNMVLYYEEGDAQQATQSIDVSGLLEDIGGVQRLPDTTVVEFLFDVDTVTGIVIPKFKIINDPQNPPADFTEMAPVPATGDVLDAIQGNFVANGVPHPLAFGNIGTSAIDPEAPAQAIEDDNVNVTYDEFKVVGFAPNVDAFVVLTGADATVNEDVGTVALAIELQDEFGNPVTLGEDVTVNFSVDGTATSPDDFALSTASPVIIPSGTSSVPLTLTIVDDETLETDETVEITLGAIAANGLAVIAKATADSGTITIESDDSGNILYRVNAGGPEITSLDGGPNWASDTAGANNPNLLDAGSNNTNGFAVVPGVDIPDRVPDVVFETERWENSGGTSMQWGFDVDPGVYEVNLYLGNGFGGTSAPGERVFDVAIEGVVLDNTDNIDLSAQFGHLVGGVITATVEVTDGQLNLEFLHVTENPLINAIEIIGPPPAPALPQVSLATDAVTVNEADGSISLTVQSDTTLAANDDVTVTFEIASGTATSEADFDFDGSTPTGGVYTGTVIIPGGTSENSIDIDILQDTDIEPNETFTVTITGVTSNAEIAAEDSTVVTITDDDTPTPQPGDVVYRVNAGTATTITSTDGGPDWIGDVNLIGANPTGAELSGNTADTFSNLLTDAEDEVDLTNLENAVPWELFVFERGDNTVDATTLDYSFDVTPGTTYEVTIYYTENWNNIFTGGPRIFDVEVEGAVPVEFADIHPLREITDIIDGPEAPLPDFPNGNQAAKQPYLGTALSRTVTVTAQDSELNLSFIHNDPASQNPKVNAIEIKVAEDTSTQDVTITAQDISADESTGEITITFDISETVTDGDITIPFTLVDGTATIGTDTTPNQDGSVTFTAGDGSDQTVVITLVNDDLVEGDESFTVVLGTPTAVPANVNVTTVDGTATILDDDVATVDSFNGTDAPGGDWSNSNTAPDDVALIEGTNTLVSAGASGDADYITFTVAEGQQVTSITLVDYVGGGNSAFLGIQVGDSVPTQGEIEGGTATLDGGTVYNFLQEGIDLLPLLASTSVENAGQPTNGLATPLQAGTYTLWFNQNQDLTESTLAIVSEAVPGPDVTISIADASTVQENGDVDPTVLAFALTASDATFSGNVTITYDQDGQTGLTQSVNFVEGLGTLSVSVPSDDVNTGGTIVSVTLTGADDGGTTSLGIDGAADNADGTINEDDTSAFIGADIEVGDVVLAINSGPGGAITNDPIFGIDFKADEQFETPSSTYLDGAAGGDTTGNNPALDGSILETERFATSLTYTLTQLGDGTPLVAGEEYVLDLILTELFQDTSGERIFDIIVNGDLLVDDLDIVAQIGVDDQTTSEVEGIYRLRTTVTVDENGQILIELPASEDNGKLNGLILFQQPVADGIISIDDAPTLVESGDTDDTTLVFPLTITGPDPAGPVTIDYTVDGVATSADVTFSGGTATLEVAVPNDIDDNGTETVTVALTGVPAGFTIDAAGSTASGSVTEDDAPNPDDIDEDGILNTDDPFAYDGTNGDAKSLATAGEFLQDFNTDTTDPFSAAGGFSGIITNPAFDPPGASASDPYGDRTTEDGVSISGGFLSVDSSNTDLFQSGLGSGSNAPDGNTIKDNYQSAVDVTGVDAFEVVARAQNPFFGGSAPTSFASFGITIGAGGVDDYIKLVFGGSGNGPRIEMASENSILGGANITLSSAEIVANDVAEVEFRLFVDTAAGANGQVQGTVTFFDDTGAEIGSIDTSVVDIDPAGSLLDALNGQNPLTGGDGGLAYGISITDWGGADGFTGSWDFLRITSLDAPADETPPVASFDVVADITDADAPIIITATITDETALDDGTVEQGDVTLSGPGVTDQSADAFSFDAGTGIASWTFNAPVDGWENGVFTATLAAGSVEDLADNPIAETTVTATVDLPPIVVSILDAPDVVEAGGDGTTTPLAFEITADQPVDGDITVEFTLDTGEGPVAQTQLVTLVAGAGTLTVDIANDDEDNGPDDATIVVTGITEPGFDVGTDTATGTVTEDDEDTTPPTGVIATIDDLTDTSAPIIVEVTYDDDVELDVSSIVETNLSLTGPGLTAPVNATSVSFEPTTGVATYTFDAPAGGWDEGTFDIALIENAVTDTAGNGVAASSATVIVDEPDAVLISISDPAPIQETGDEGTNTPVVFDVQLSEPQAVTLTLAITIALNDGVAGTPTPVLVAFDETGAGQFTLNVPNDDVDDGPLSIEVTLFGIDEAGFAIDPANAVATGTVTEDDQDTTPPTGVIATIDDLTDTSAPIIVEVTYDDDVELDVGSIVETNLSLTGPGLAAPVNATSVSFEPTTGVATYTFDAPAGGWDEGTFDIALIENAVTDTAGNGVAASSATVIVDEPLTVSLVQPTVTALVEEDEDAFLLTVQLSETSTETVTVNYEVTGTATDGSDYRIVPPTVVEIAPGETEGTLILEILNDSEFEEIEDFTVTLTTTSAGVIDPASNSASFTIESLDPDVPPTGDPIMLEAEDFTGLGSSAFFSQFAIDASENELIRVGTNTDTATVDTTLPGEVTPGVYTVAVTYFDESDGQSSASIAIDGTTVGSWVFNKDGPSNAAQGANLRTVVFENVEINAGSIFSLTGDRDDDEFLRIDKVTFTKTGELPEGDPPVGTDIPDLVEVAAGDDVDIAYSYSDPDGGAVTVSAALSDGNALPEWLTVTDTGLAGTPPLEAIGQDFEITLTVEDDEGDTLVDTFTISLLAPVDETGPTAAIAGAAPATPFDDLVLTVTLVDPAGIDESTIDDADLVVTGPSGAIPAGVAGTFDAVTGTVTYTFAAPATGWETGSYTASFADGAVADLLSNLSSAATDLVLSIQGDDTAPVPSVAASEPVDANSPIIVTVTLDEAFDIDEATVEATDFTLTGPDGAATQAAGSPVFDAVAKTATFTFDPPAGGWANGAYQAAFGDGAVSDAAGNPSDPVLPFDFTVTTGIDPATPGANLDEDFDTDGTINSADDDIDEDGLVNLADRFAYDATNQGEDLSEVGQVVISFDGLEAGDSPFTAGFTGVMPATDAAVVELDYSTNNGAAVVDTPNGKRLQFETTALDTADGQTALTFGAQVQEDFTFSGTFDNPYFSGTGEVPNNFEQYGLILGFSGTDFLKLVAGSPGNAFEISGDLAGAGIGTDDKVGLPAGIAVTDYAQVELKLTGEVSPAGVTITGEYVLLDAAGQSIGAGVVGSKTITSGPIFDAIVSGTGGPVAFGLTSTHFGGGADPFTVSLEELSLVATDLIDVEGPTAIVSVEDIADANSDIVVEVTFADDTGVDALSIDGDEIALTSNAGDSFPVPAVVDNGDGSYTYTFAAPAGGWQGTSFTAALAAGTVTDTSPDANANDAGAPVAFAREDVDPVDEILTNLTGVDTDGDYGAGATGSAILTILDGVNNVQASNFGSNSFELTNTGDKQVAAVFIDVRDALYGDSVFDFDGSAGDTVTQPFQVGNEGGNGTGAFFTPGEDGTYFLAGDDPLPNTTGSGVPSTGGFKGLLLKFDGSEGGFSAGEFVSFGGDMDPNSIAGLLKPLVDSGAIDGWDVGGVSGAELIGSSFTVLFDDGTTATGYLHSDNSQAGSVGEALQGRANSEVSVTVNGFTAGDLSASYGGTEPVIVVTGEAGATVRVVLSHGINPVTNDDQGAADLVANRLADAQADFQVNNAARIQTVDVVLDENGQATVPQGAFDYVNSLPGVDYPDYAIAPIAVAAAAIDDSTDGSVADQIAIGPVSDPVYLTNPTGTPVDPDIPIVTEVYLAENGTVVFEAEDADRSGTSGWLFETVAEATNENPDPQGDGYIIWEGGNSFGDPAPNSTLNYTFQTDEGGNYTLKGMFGRRNEPDTTEANDVFVRLVDSQGNPVDPVPQTQGGQLVYHVKTGEVVPEDEFTAGNNNIVVNNPEKWMKFYIGGVGLNELNGGGVNGDFGGINVVYALDPNETYTLQVAGRSNDFEIDRWALSNDGAGAATNAAETGEASEKVVLGPSEPVVDVPIPDQSVEVGEALSFTIPAGTFDDADGDILTLTAPGLPAGFSFDGTTLTAPGTLAPGDYQITIVATDDDQNSVSDTFTVSVVTEPDSAIILNLIDPVTDQVVRTLNDTDLINFNELSTGQYNLEAVYADGGEESIQFLIDGSPVQLENFAPYAVFGDSGGNFGGVDLPAEGDSFQLTINVYSGNSASGTLLDTRTVTLLFGEGELPNQAPIVVAPIADDTVDFEEAVSIDVTGVFSDPEQDALTFGVNGLPAGLSFDGSTISGQPTEDGTFTVTVSASDGEFTTTDTFELIVLPEGGTIPFADVPIADQSVQEGDALSFTIPGNAFDDLDGDVLTLTAPGLPAGFGFNGTTLTAPSTLAIGDYDITIVATDDDGNSANQTFTVSVTPEPDSSIIINLIDPATDQVIRQLSDDDLVNFSELSTGQYAIEAVFDGTGDDSMQFFIDGNLVATENNPPYTLFGDNGGDFGGVDLPAEGESLTFSVSAFSGGSGSGELLDTRTITIFFGEGELPNQAPDVVAPIADDTVDFEEAVSIDVTGVFSDPEQDALTFGVSGLPAGLSFDGSTISGQPTEDGTFTVTVSASDGEFTTTDTFELTVLPDGGTIPFADVDIPDQNVQEGEAFSFTIPGNAFDDLDGDALTLTAPGLPAGFGFNGTTVTAPGTLALGDYDITIVATDDDGNSANQTFTVSVTPEPDTVPTVDVPISDQSIEEGQSLNFTIPGNAFDDEDGDELTLTAPDLPAGFNFNGTTLTSSGGLAPGDYDITIVATDDDGNSVDQTFTVTVTPPNVSGIQLLLIDPQSNQVIRELSVNDIIATDELPSGEYNIQAVYTPGGEESAVFSINGQQEQTESGAPYALFSDNGGFFNGVNPEASGTVWNLTVEIFSQNSGNGTLLDSQTFTLTFADTAAAPQAQQSILGPTGFALDGAPTDLGEEEAGLEAAPLATLSASNFASSQQVEQISLLQVEEEAPADVEESGPEEVAAADPAPAPEIGTPEETNAKAGTPVLLEAASAETGPSEPAEKAPLPEGVQLLTEESGASEVAVSEPGAHNNKAAQQEVPLPDTFDFDGLAPSAGSSTLNDMLDMIDAANGGPGGSEETPSTEPSGVGLEEDTVAPDPTWSKLDDEAWDTPG